MMADAAVSDATMAFVHPAVTTLQAEELLDAIDEVRQLGLGKYIDTPLVAVCGDQSSGKSVCLEGLTGYSFPSNEGLCTRFATELVLRRSPIIKVNIGITPDPDKTEAEKKRLAQWRPSTNDTKHFPTILEEASQVMGIGIENGGKRFSRDCLRVELSGPTQPHFTLIDTPGLFNMVNHDQTQDDKNIVDTLVRSFIGSSRTIILQVLSASNDVNLQRIVNFVDEHDPQGLRTLGLITKPDTLPIGSGNEANYLDIALNKRLPLQHGWHVLRNRNYGERHSSAIERDQREDQFFAEGVWKALSSNDKGVGSLRNKLSNLLQDHIRSELPGLIKDLDEGISDCKTRLTSLGGPRTTLTEQRQWLVNASHEYTTLMAAAVSGQYRDPFFGTAQNNSGFQKRLCAYTKAIMGEFRERMHKKGHAVQIVARPSKVTPTPGMPQRMTEEEFYHDVQCRMTRNSGQELRGLLRPEIVIDLFRDQSQPWSGILNDTTSQIIEAGRWSVSSILDHVAPGQARNYIAGEILVPALETVELDFKNEVEKLLDPYINGQPSTSNHYFIENLQNKRREQARQRFATAIETQLAVSPLSRNREERIFEGKIDTRALLDALSTHNEVNMEKFAAVEASNATFAYYKDALKNVVDAFEMYAVDSCFINKLVNIFTPWKVATLDDDTIKRIAGESDEIIHERVELQTKLEALEKSQRALHRLGRQDKGARILSAPQYSGPEDQLSRGGAGGASAAAALYTSTNKRSAENSLLVASKRMKPLLLSNPITLREALQDNDTMSEEELTGENIDDQAATMFGIDAKDAENDEEAEGDKDELDPDTLLKAFIRRFPKVICCKVPLTNFVRKNTKKNARALLQAMQACPEKAIARVKKDNDHDSAKQFREYKDDIAQVLGQPKSESIAESDVLDLVNGFLENDVWI